MGNRHRHAVAKGSSSALLFLIIASAVLAFIPFRVTLAVGSTVSIFAPAYQLQQFPGTHIDIDSLGIFLRTPKLHIGPTPLSIILANIGLTTLATYVKETGKIPLVGNGTALPLLPATAGTIGFPINSIDFFTVKAQKITIDVAVASGNMTGLLLPFGAGPALVSGSGKTIQVRFIIVSITITGYKATTIVSNIYGEDNLASMNPIFSISFDRLFLDLFVDPAANTSTYIVSADMTVYQGFAIMLETAFLE